MEDSTKWISIVVGGVCLALVFALVIWNIVHTVQQFKRLHADLDNRRAMDAAQNRRLLHNARNLADIDKRLSTTTAKVTDVEKTVGVHGKAIVALGAAFSDHDAKIDSLGGDMDMVKSDVNDLQSQYADVSSRANTTASSLSTLQGQYKQYTTTTDASLAQLQQGANTIGTRVNKLESTTSDLSSSFSAYRSDVSNMVDTSSKKLAANTLCLEATCITAAQLQGLSPAQLSTAPTSTPTPTPTSTSTSTSTPTSSTGATSTTTPSAGQ